MISAGKLRNGCPGCRAQVLNFYDALLLPGSRAISRPLLRSAKSSLGSPRSVAWRPNSIRNFSSTRPTFQETTQQASVPEPEPEPERSELDSVVEDAETIVRQARQTFGTTLPPNYLTAEEYQIYERLYGPPLRETAPEDVGIKDLGEGAPVVNITSKHTILIENEDGVVEEFEFSGALPPDLLEEAAAHGVTVETEPLDSAADDLPPPLTEAQIEYLNITANNQREYDALIKLQRDFEAASLRSAPEIAELEAAAEEEALEEEAALAEQEELEDLEEQEKGFYTPPAPWEDPQTDRVHPHTLMGRYGPNPSTVFLPKETFVRPISELLKRTDSIHIKEQAEKIFGGPGLPFSPATPALGKSLPQKPIQMEAGHHRMSPIEADTFLATVLPGVYASVMSTLVEVRKRLGSDWLRDLCARGNCKGPRILDVGGGGAGLLAFQEILQADWDVRREKGEVTEREPPLGKQTVVVGSDTLRHRVSRFLHDTTFLPRLPDYLHSQVSADRELDAGEAPQRKEFDIIIASHMLMPDEKPWRRKAFIDNLWTMLSPKGGVLIVLEKGHPRGFEAVADVRQRMIEEFLTPPLAESDKAPGELTDKSQQLRVREPGMIIAPCTNHSKCPMYLTPGLSQGRKDFCHFSQRFIRPPFLQKVLGSVHRNHEDINFSYIAVRRGGHAEGVQLSSTDATAKVDASVSSFVQNKDAVDRAFAGYENEPAPHPLSLPRIVNRPLKARGHITLDLCTPVGSIERWVVPKSFSKQAYRDARKVGWGDLWALGAKTRTRRDPRLGKGVVPQDGGVRAQYAKDKRKKPTMVEILADPRHGIVGAKQKVKGRQPIERRTKGGRIVKINNLMEELGFDDKDDPEWDDDMKYLNSGKVRQPRPVPKKRQNKNEEGSDLLD